MDVFEFVQHLQVIDDILVTAVGVAMFVAMAGYAYPEVNRVACRVLVTGKYYRGYRG
jgi:hypothetical protein